MNVVTYLTLKSVEIGNKLEAISLLLRFDSKFLKRQNLPTQHLPPQEIILQCLQQNYNYEITRAVPFNIRLITEICTGAVRDVVATLSLEQQLTKRRVEARAYECGLARPQESAAEDADYLTK